jgi:hypothetical protein
MKRLPIFVYSLICCSVCFASALYAAGLVGNLFVPKSIDSPAECAVFDCAERHRLSRVVCRAA